MKKYFCFSIILAILLNSCIPYNKLSSPEVLELNDKSVSFALVSSNALMPFGDRDVSLSPMIAYRFGLKSAMDLGLRLDLGPLSASVDLKHNFIKRDNFYLTGDLSVFTIWFEEFGSQYDLIFGNRSLYGSCGILYAPGIRDANSLIIGIGTESGDSKRVGFQISYLVDIFSDQPENEFSIGLIYSLYR